MFIYYKLTFMNQATFPFCKVFYSPSMDRIDHTLSQRALTDMHLDSPLLQLLYLFHHSLSVIILGSGISYIDNFHSDLLILGGTMGILSNCVLSPGDAGDGTLNLCLSS